MHVYSVELISEDDKRVVFGVYKSEQKAEEIGMQFVDKTQGRMRYVVNKYEVN